jgi:phage shock protein E
MWTNNHHSNAHPGRQEAHQLVADGALLLDVRTREEFGERHIKGAVNIPVQELGSRLGELGSKERPVVVYCRSGGRSAAAAAMMKAAGYRVLDLGGIHNW